MKSGLMKKAIHLLFICILLSLFLFSACCGFRLGRGSYTESAPMEADEEYYESEKMMKSEGAPAPEPAVSETMSSEEPGGQVTAASVPDADEQKEERKRIYSGYVSLLVDEIEEEKSRIAEIANAGGGYVESSFGNSVIIRIPALKFDAVMEEILSLEEVLNKSVETFDVTEYFQDLTTRITIAKDTRERLYALLEKTDDVAERVKILREIRRLTEEIERINTTMETLKKQIEYSRITVDLVSRLEQYAQERGVIPFGWIGELNPLSPSIYRIKGKIDFPLDDEYALFSKEKYFRAENAELVRIRVGTIANQPAGDAAFWQKALSFHLSPFYRNTEVKDLEDIRAVVFTSKDADPYYYLVGVTVKRKQLYVIEVFFPDMETFKEKGQGIFTSLEQFQVR